MSLGDAGIESIHQATALVTEALGELRAGQKIGATPPPGLPGIDAMIAEAGGLLPVVASSLVGISVALLIALSRATGQPPEQIWQRYLQDAEARRSV